MRDTSNQPIHDNFFGNTPLVELKSLSKDWPFTLYGKFELSNPGGSMKDRAAASMLGHAIESGRLKPGMTVIESSSGNMGVGLALACRRLGLRFVCVTDKRINRVNIKIMKTLNARVHVIDGLDGHPDLLSARLSWLQDYLSENTDVFWPNQYNNYDNARGYFELMSELKNTLSDEPDFLFCATGTCGTIRGCADYIRDNNMATKIVAVDAVGSVIFGNDPGPRHIPGHGAAIRPGLFRSGMASEVVHVDDLHAIAGCNLLLRREGILAGGSTGAIVCAMQRFGHKIPAGSSVVVIIGDRGERYLDTIYNSEWLKRYQLVGKTELENVA